MSNLRNSHLFGGKAVLLFAMLGILVAVAFTAPKAAYAMSDESIYQSKNADTYWGPTPYFDALTHDDSNNMVVGQELNPTDVANPWKETSTDGFSFRGQSGFDDTDGHISKNELKALTKGF